MKTLGVAVIEWFPEQLDPFIEQVNRFLDGATERVHAGDMTLIDDLKSITKQLRKEIMPQLLYSDSICLSSKPIKRVRPIDIAGTLRKEAARINQEWGIDGRFDWVILEHQMPRNTHSPIVQAMLSYEYPDAIPTPGARKNRFYVVGAQDRRDFLVKCSKTYDANKKYSESCFRAYLRLTGAEHHLATFQKKKLKKLDDPADACIQALVLLNSL